MAELTVDAVYGTALFDVAMEQDMLVKIQEDFDLVIRSLSEEPMFFEFLTMPTIPKDVKKQVIRDCFAGQISQELLNFMFVLIDKKRSRNLREIAKFYRKKMDTSRNISSGVIISVEALTQEELASFEGETGKLLRKTVKLKNETDPSIIGGVKILIEGKIIDATIQKRLHNLKESLSQLAV